MRRNVIAVCTTILFFQSVGWAGNLVITPTTTLSQQTSNNTSALNVFPARPNLNAAAGNVSKLDIHSLLYPGANTHIYAHLMLWFGSPKHMNVGYNSADSRQVKRQIEDMVSRGIEGVLIDWYGSGTDSDLATRQVIKEAELHPGFSVGIIVDVGTIKWNSCFGCSPQQALAAQLQYIERNYFNSPAYMRLDGRPVVSNFDVDLLYKIDWQAAKDALASDPVFIFQHNNGFTHVLTAGSYSWVIPTTTDFGTSYLSSFYQTGQSHPNLQTIGAAYKGFNDTQASWGANRIMDQQCGQTWLRTFSDIKSLYNSGNQLDALQLVTWNDYEEGTEIESGMDNCVSITASVSGDQLQWSIAGQENTLHHYQIFISKDGQNLMPLADLATGLRSVNLCSFPLSVANYKLFVNAVGQPSLANHISSAVSYRPHCSTSSGQPIKLEATPASLKISPGKSGNVTLDVSSSSGALDGPVVLACSDLPIGMSCSFVPATVTSSTGKASSSLAISVGQVFTSFIQGKRARGVFYASLMAFGMVGLVGLGQIKRKRVNTLLGFAVLGGVALFTSCGGGSSHVQSGSTYNVTVLGTAGDAQVATTISVVVD